MKAREETTRPGLSIAADEPIRKATAMNTRRTKDMKRGTRTTRERSGTPQLSHSKPNCSAVGTGLRASRRLLGPRPAPPRLRPAPPRPPRPRRPRPPPSSDEDDDDEDYDVEAPDVVDGTEGGGKAAKVEAPDDVDGTEGEGTAADVALADELVPRWRDHLLTSCRTTTTSRATAVPGRKKRHFKAC